MERYEVSDEITVRVRRNRARPSADHFKLPCKSTCGVVAFFRNDMRSGVWLGELDDDFRHLVPSALWDDDPYATLDHHPSDKTTIQHGAGSTETRWPDGSLRKLTTRKDGSVSNTGKRSSQTPRKMSRKTGKMKSERQDYQPHSEPPVDAVFKHASGAEVHITADGSFNLRTARGHTWRLHDATEKARDPDTGNPTSTPEEDANRIASEIVLESEIGHRLRFQDDPEDAANDRHVLLETATGHYILMRDTDPNDQHVAIQTAAGHQLELRDTPDDDVYARLKTIAGHLLELRDAPIVEARLQTPGGREVHLDDEGNMTTLRDPALIIVDAPQVQLAGGGAPVARVGDTVQVIIPSGSSAGTYTGQIMVGSPHVSSS